MGSLSERFQTGVSTMRQASADITAAGDIAVNIESYGRHLRAENLSPRTQQTYTESAHQLACFLTQQGMPPRAPRACPKATASHVREGIGLRRQAGRRPTAGLHRHGRPTG